MKNTNLQDSIIEFEGNNPGASEQEKSEALGVSIDRLRKEKMKIQAKGTNDMNFTKIADEMILRAATKKYSCPAALRIMALETAKIPCRAKQDNGVSGEVARKALNKLGHAEDVSYFGRLLPDLDQKKSSSELLLSVENPPDDVVKAWKHYGGHLIKVAKRPHYTVISFMKEICLPLNAQPIKVFRQAGEILEEQGLAVFASDDNGILGITLTETGIEYAETLRQSEQQKETERRRANHIPRAIRCGNCGHESLQTSFWFETGAPVTGKMLSPYGAAVDGNWSLPFGHEDSGENIVCLSCGESITDEHGRIPEEWMHAI